MLWNVVYEFFIIYIFGGAINGEYYRATLGDLYLNGVATSSHMGLVNVYSFTDIFGNTRYVSLGNYLSLIATIISMIIILVLCCALIKKIYNMCAHIIG